VLQYLVGGVSRLWARTRTGAHDKIEVEDIAVACFSYANGAVGTFTATTAAYKGFRFASTSMVRWAPPLLRAIASSA